jgi:hypothetical protein
VRKWLAGAAVIAALVVFAHEIIDYFAGISAHLSWSGSSAVITVQAPAVHTRERLMNDRFEQVSWLEEQLKYTTNKSSRADYASPRDKTGHGRRRSAC